MAKKPLTPEQAEIKAMKKAKSSQNWTKFWAIVLAAALTVGIVFMGKSQADNALAAVGTVQGGDENTDTQTPDTQTPDTQTPDTQTPDTQTPDTQTPDTQTPSGDTNTPSGNDGSANNQPSADTTKADAIKAVNDATAKASKGNYHWERESYYTKPLEVSGKDTLNKVISMVDKSGTATVESVVGGFLDITGEGNFMTADVQKGQLAVGMKDNPKFLMIASKLTEADVTKAEVNGNTYKLYLKDCNRPQKDGSNALNRVTNDFITCDEVNKALADAGAGSLVKANDIDVTFKSIVVTAEIADGKLVKYDISYTMDVVNMDLKALGMVTVTGSGAGVMKCSYTNIKY